MSSFRYETGSLIERIFLHDAHKMENRFVLSSFNKRWENVVLPKTLRSPPSNFGTVIDGVGSIFLVKKFYLKIYIVH